MENVSCFDKKIVLIAKTHQVKPALHMKMIPSLHDVSGFQFTSIDKGKTPLLI